jgi:hypothetical protein
MWWLLASLAFGQAELPSDHTLVYYNARMALREGEAVEAVKLWLLRNALEDQTDRVSAYDGDFHSITWAALGKLGICQDGHPRDDDGVGLWPIALHNWVVVNRTRRLKQQRPKVIEAFQLGIQQRFFSIGDVLSAKELQSVRLYRGRCTRARLALLAAGESVTAKLSDRTVAANLLQHLLERSRETLDRERVRGMSIIDARLFDIHLLQTELAAREARLAARKAGREGREIGMSRESVTTMRTDASTTTLSPHSKAAGILEASVDWPVDGWMALSGERRLFLFDKAKAYGEDLGTIDHDAFDRIALGVIDRLIAQGEGGEVEKWIAHRSDDPAMQSAIWSGDRGQTLLALDNESGFRERSVIALHRGVNQLERGDLPSALRSMAYALMYSPESRAGGQVHSLSLRWLTYVASQFEITDSLLITLQELVPRRDYGVMLEDLMWGAAFRADQRSFDRGIRNQVGRGALERRIRLLQPLARGDVRGFSRLIDTGLKDSPSETVRFLSQWVERLELEDGDVRTAHIPTLKAIRTLLAPLADQAANGRQGRSAALLMERTQAILEGLDGLGPDASHRDRARSLGPSQEVYAGSVRLAPSDPLPWPFRAIPVPAPSIFEPIELTPLEWRERDEWVLGWMISG